jgi:hypothetical protein
LLLLVATAALVVWLVTVYAKDSPTDRCVTSASTHHGITGYGIAVAGTAVVAAGTSLWRVARRRPSVLWAVIGFFGSWLLVFAWAFVTVAVTGC